MNVLQIFVKEQFSKRNVFITRREKNFLL